MVWTTGVILFIEDDKDIREGIETFFEWEGLDVHAVRTGEEAVHWAQRHVPDLVLLDIGLPGMDGRQTAEELKSIWMSDVPFLVVTADGRIEEKAESIHANAYIKKPYDLMNVANTCRTYLESRHGPYSDPYGFSAERPTEGENDQPVETEVFQERHHFKNPFRRNSWLQGTGDYSETGTDRSSETAL